jgi:hypothetical protein
LLIGILLPAIGQARNSAKNLLSQNQMRQLNLGSNTYAADNDDRVFSYTWKAGQDYLMPDGKLRRPTDNQDAASWQQTEILMRVTGRSEGPFRFKNFGSRLAHRRYSHIVLLDYLTTTQPEPIAASPFDKNLLDWQAQPTVTDASNNIPYAAGSDYSGYDDPGGWTDPGVKQRWSFASTYQTVPAAWNTDGINGQVTCYPVATTPHLFATPNTVRLGERKYGQVAHPAGKVLQFEEFDRFSSRSGLYFMYPDAQSNLSFFDGSVRRERTGDANPGWNPNTPNAEWKQRYVPLHTFPEPKTGLNEQTTYCQRYRWTRYGLQGIDYGGKEIGRPSSLPDERDADCGG